LAIANSAGNGQKRGFVQILLGNGDGTFQAPIRNEAGKSPAFLAIGDLNGDGRLDLVTFDICPICSTFRVNALLGNGDGTFKVAWTSKGGSAPSAIALGDFNGDGKLDLALAESIRSRFSIRLGDGDGTFRDKVNYAVDRGPDSIVVADFDGDGNLDAAVANAGSANVSVLLGKGDGTFKPASNYALTLVAWPVEMVAADVNGDGKPDLVVTDHFNKVVSVLLNTSP
jgi:hypothetical protein